MKELSEEVHSRLLKIDQKFQHITLKLKKKNETGESYKFLGHGRCIDMSKSKSLTVPTADVDVIYKESLSLLKLLQVRC
jgi:nucleotidyltransferase/DNA polymerase involved in DNA repair